MKRFPMIGILLLIPALALTVFVGCTKDGAKDGKTTTESKTTDGTKGGGPTKEITTATSATVKGTVKLKGEAPAMKPIAKLPEHNDKDHCMKGDTKEQMWNVGKDGLVENVVVWLAPPDGKSFKITDALKDPFKKKVVEIDQPFCQYIPHVVAVYADLQEFRALNSAPIPHNVRILASPKNGGTEIHNLKPKEPSPKRTFKKEDSPIKIECSAHTWMNAQIHTFDHPYFAVTGKDGSFVIENVPIGEELQVYTWHESPGKVMAQKATFKEGPNTLDLTVSPGAGK
jgi:hypothetical protein